MTVTNRGPHPIRYLDVLPAVTCARGRAVAVAVEACALVRAAESVWPPREPSRYTVMPLHPSSKANRNTLSTSDSGALADKFTVLDTALSTCSWKAACTRTCHSGLTSCAVTRTSAKWCGTQGT